MNMQNTSHPHDERLAAYADRDADALRDRTLSDHLAGCDRCRLFLGELASLRSALAELPDVVPSRPLRLIPPVPEPAPAGGRTGWLRRLTAPAFAAGTGLVLVGAVGASGALGGFAGAASMAAPEANATGDLSAASQPGAARSSSDEYVAPSAAESAGPGDDAKGMTGGPLLPPPPWSVFLIAGLGLLAAAAVMRFSLQPRAG